MSTPRDFFLEPRRAFDRPSPVPPQNLKGQIYNDPAVFRSVDEHAINISIKRYKNFRDLLWNLIFKKQFNELEKARAIFRWMTAKDLLTVKFDSELPGSPEHVLGSFKNGNVTYAKIFECFAVYSGLHCVSVSGWAKGVDYKPGLPITSSPPNHTWSVIFIDGNWQLVDCHWAARYLTSERVEDSSLVYEYDDYYFLTEPSMLIYTHYPEEPAWQLLHPAKTMKVYEEYPLVKSYFFSTGMQFLQQNRGIVHTKNGVATLTLGYTQPSAFTFKLGYGEKSVENLQGIQFKRYIIQETTETRVTFYFRSPREGNFYLMVFSQLESARSLKEQNVFKAVCEYKIVCDQPASDIRPFPPCDNAEWGAGKLDSQYGLVANYKTALLAAQNGRAEIVFTNTREARIYTRLVRDEMDDETLEKAVGVREQDNLAVIDIILSTTGEYGLEVYANQPMQDGETFTHVYQYLVAYVDRELGEVYGQVFDRADLAPGMQASSMLYSMPMSPCSASVRKPKRDSIANSELSLEGYGSEFSPQLQQQQQQQNKPEIPEKPLENDVTEKVPVKERSRSESLSEEFSNMRFSASSQKFVNRVSESVKKRIAYKCDSRPLGRAIIINNEYFFTLNRRQGATEDGKWLEYLFNSLNFETEVFENLSSTEIVELLERESKAEHHKRFDAFALFLLSHGRRNEIYGIDETTISIDSITTLFDGRNCSHLINKPKLFFIQACQGETKTKGVIESDFAAVSASRFSSGKISKDPGLNAKVLEELSGVEAAAEAKPPSREDVKFKRHELVHDLEKSLSMAGGRQRIQSDGTSKAPTHEKADMAIVYSTTNGYVALRHTEKGSFFVQSLVEVFSKRAHEDDLQSMLTEVMNILHDQPMADQKQIGEKRDTLRRKVYLLPRPHSPNSIPSASQ